MRLILETWRHKCMVCKYLFMPNLNSSSGQNGRHFADDDFTCIFFTENVLYLDQNFTEFCPQASNRQWPSIGLDNSLVPNRRQAIIWTNADPIHWIIYVTIREGRCVKRYSSKKVVYDRPWMSGCKIKETMCCNYISMYMTTILVKEAHMMISITITL